MFESSAELIRNISITMAEDQVQPPRYTSTPLAGRKTSNVLRNFTEVSPIFSSPAKKEKAKSFIPVSTTNEISKRCISRFRAGPSNFTGQSSSSSSVKMQSQNQEPKPDKIVVNSPQASRASPSQIKPQVSRVVTSKEPRNSIEEVIESVIRSQSQKEISSQRFSEQDALQTKSSRASKISQRPSTLPSVPEESSNEGVKQLREECIFKESQTKSGWLVPKETKTRVSLKRKSNVPTTVTKRSKLERLCSQDDDDLFGSPVLPNLVEISSLRKRQTYVLKKKQETTIIEEECKESVTDGIIPLQNLSQNSPLARDKSRENLKRNPSKENNKTFSKTTPKNNSEGTGKVEDVALTDQNKSNKKNVKKQPEKQLTECVNMELSNNKTESVVTNSLKDTKLTEFVKAQNEVEQNLEEFKENLVDQTKEKRKNTKSKKREPSLIKGLETDNLKNSTGSRRTLRERKPNVRYLERSEISGNNIKANGKSKNKNALLKMDHKEKENLNELPLENKSKENTVKGSKKTRSQSVADKIESQPHSTEDTDDVKVINISNNISLKEDSKTRDEAQQNSDTDIADTDEPMETKCFAKLKKKETENKRNPKRVTKIMTDLPVEEAEEEIDTNLVQESSKTKTKKSLAVSKKPTNSNGNAPFKKQTTLANKEANSEYQNIGASTQQLQLVLPGPSSKSTSNGTSESEVYSETKNRHKTVSENIEVEPSNDKNSTVKSANKATNDDGQSTNGKISKVGKTYENKMKVSKHRSKGQSKVEQPNSDACEQFVTDYSKKLPEDKNIPERDGDVSSRKKPKSEDMECGGFNSETSAKNRKFDLGDSENVKSDSRSFSIKDLFGRRKINTQETQPGVKMTPAIHIPHCAMMGKIRLEPGAAINKIKTNTMYWVREGTAHVTIQGHSQCFGAGDSHREFFIPKNMLDVSITNVGNLPLNMDFGKFAC